MKYFVTFGQNHVNPETGEKMKDYWLELEADNRQVAFEAVRERLGLQFSMIYNSNEFDSRYFPKGNYDLEMIEGLTVDEMFERFIKRQRDLSIVS